MSEELVLDIEGLAHDGRGVGRHGGQVVFVDGALPGQRVRVRLLRRRTRLLEAGIEDILLPAPDTRAPLCPHVGQCGGCPLQTMPYATQLHWKRRLALDALSRVGHMDAAMLEELMPLPAPSPQQTAFRNKMEFAFGPGPAGGLVLGQRRRGTAEVAATPDCALLPNGGRAILAAVEQLTAESGLAPYRAPAARSRRAGQRHDRGFWRFLILRHGQVKESPYWWAIIVTSPGGKKEQAVVRRLSDQIMKRCPQLACIIHEERHTADALCHGESRVFSLSHMGEREVLPLSLPLGGRLFMLDPASFFQVNTAAAQLLVRQSMVLLQPETPGERLLDLYCGVGAPGQLLAPGYAHLLGIEYDTRAVAAARENASLAGLGHCRYKAGDAAGYVRSLMQEHSSTFQTVVVDPPRSGMAREVLAALVTLAPKRILYISCNASTLARDALALKEKYTLVHLGGFDLFPHTPHLECLALWQRKTVS